MTATLEREPVSADEALAKPDPKDMAKATIVLSLHIRMPSFRRRMLADDVVDEADVDPDMLHVSKDLLDREALSALVGERDKFKRLLKRRAVPYRFLPGGMLLLPLRLMERVDGEVGEFVLRWNDLVEELVVKYEVYKEAAKERLKDHYDEAEYPSARALQRAFTVEAKWLTLDVPAALKTFNRAIYEREREKARQQWAEASEDVRLALREGLAAMVSGFADKLGVDDKGKKRTFRDATMANLQDFLSTFDARNLTDDAELASLANQARQVLKGVDPDKLRKQDTTRDRVRADFEQIKAKLDTLLVPAGRRRLAIDDEEV
jgi:hypothetical protein